MVPDWHVVLKYDDPCSELTVYGPFKSKETASTKRKLTVTKQEKEHPAKGSINFGQINSESDRQYVILAGSLASGIECYGPFTHDESLGFIGLFKYKYPEIPLQRMALKGHSIP